MKIFCAVCLLVLAPAALSERVSAESRDTRVERAQDSQIPELTAPVNDFAGVIDASSENELDTLVRKLQGATGDVMAVATIKTFQPEADLKSYAVKMFENRGKGIGEKGKDNGVLIVLALDDRQVWIEEGELIVVPKGVEHRPVAEEEVSVMLFEPASTLNTGNVRGEMTVDKLDRI